ncbi:MAG: hypothetical protein NW216_04115 [Hyphomicrobium sp.]|nr:hypothetical protein [Hyphomicrobium sp.]
MSSIMAIRISTLLAVFATALVATTSAARALEPDKDEAKLLKSCEQRICEMALTKKPQGGDLDCDLSKTWAKSTLKGGEDKSVRWGFGDAQCRVKLDIARSDVIRVLTAKQATVEVPAHEVNCTVEDGTSASEVKAKLAPKLQFKGGKVEKIWINLEKIDGPPGIKATVWTAAGLVDSIGLFHGAMVKSVNKFLLKQCAQRYDMAGNPKPDPKDLAKQRAEKAKAQKAAAVKAAAAKAAREKAGGEKAKADAAKNAPSVEKAATTPAAQTDPKSGPSAAAPKPAAPAKGPTASAPQPADQPATHQPAVKKDDSQGSSAQAAR